MSQFVIEPCLGLAVGVTTWAGEICARSAGRGMEMRGRAPDRDAGSEGRACAARVASGRS